MKLIPTLFIALLLLISASAFRFRAKTDMLDLDQLIQGIYGGSSGGLSKHFYHSFI